MEQRRCSPVCLMILTLSILAACAPTPTPLPSAIGTAPATATAPATTSAAAQTPTPPLPTTTPTPEPRHGIILDVINDVDAHALPDEAWGVAAVDMLLYGGGEVWAKERSTARVGIEADIIRVAPNTIFTLEQPSPEALRVNLQEGQMWINVEGLAPGETFEVQTPDTVASVRGTRFSVRTTPAGVTIVSTRVGTVTVGTGSQAVSVGPEQQSRVTSGGAPTAPEPMPLSEQLRWGMSSGDALDVVLPIADPTAVLTLTGTIQDMSWSADGSLYTLEYYAPIASGDRQSWVPGRWFFDMQKGVTYTLDLPIGAGGLFFSPGGQEMAYQVWNPLKGSQICTADLTGKTLACFGGSGKLGWPFWSPDGQWILFYMDVVNGKPFDGLNLFKARPDGKELTALTQETQGFNIRQSWSPSGERIAFVRAPDYNAVGDVWVMNADGSNPQKVFEGAYSAGYDHVAWNAGGDWLAVPAETGGVWLVSPDGAGAQPVPGTEGGKYWRAAWSPTVSGWPLFVFGSPRPDAHGGLWVVTGAAASPTFLGQPSWGPVWSPHGESVAFGRTYRLAEDYTSTVSEIYLFRAYPDFWR